VVDPDHRERFAPGDLASDPAAFGAVLRDEDDRMRALAYKLLGGDRDRMDGARQDAYLRAYLALPRLRRDADVGTWLYRIVYNACIDELRRDEGRPGPDDGTDAGVGGADATVRALAALPIDQRVTVVLVDGEGFDDVDAARILGVSPGTVASRLSRARAAMRDVPTDEPGAVALSAIVVPPPGPAFWADVEAALRGAMPAPAASPPTPAAAAATSVFLADDETDDDVDDEAAEAAEEAVEPAPDVTRRRGWGRTIARILVTVIVVAIVVLVGIAFVRRDGGGPDLSAMVAVPVRVS
jgi:RNA polymerase sigma-70 factor (ECF subfamily)